MDKRQRLYVAIAVLASMIGLAAYLFVARGRSIPRPSGRTYEVHYVWDNGIKSLRIVDTRTGAEERDGRWRERVSREARHDVPGLVELAGLKRATGRFYLVFLGYEEPYLPQAVWGTEDPDLIRDPDVTPLMSALARGDAPKARQLIAGGADVNAADQHGWTALMGAAGLGDAATLQALLAAGADVNAKNRDGETALFPAASLGRLAAARELVRHGADVNATSKQEITPVMEAAKHGVPVVEVLIAGGANVNAKDVLGETALMMAVRARRADIVRALLKAGANVNAKDSDGRTALSTASRLGFAEIARVLKRAGAR